MYRKNAIKISQLDLNESTEGETIEGKFERILSNNEPIGDGAPMIYTERKNGIEAGYNIRTDRFEVAIAGMDLVEKSYRAKREERHKPKKEEGKVVDMNGKPETAQGTDNQ